VLVSVGLGCGDDVAVAAGSDGTEGTVAVDGESTLTLPTGVAVSKIKCTVGV
jgi:hypothetical protein